MELTELSDDQQVTLVGLIEALAVSERTVATEEEEEINSIAEALGDETYRLLLDEAERRFPDEPRLRAALKAIADQDARELIYEKAIDTVAMEQPVGRARSALLDWLAKAWNIQVDVQGEDEASS